MLRFATSFFVFYSKYMETKSFTLPSFAKINWNLKIIGKREDGYHELFTIFQTVSLFDEISFEESDELILTCDQPNIPTDKSNLIFKAAESLKDLVKTRNGAKIHLKKNIPAPGGLGGGSSNAAVALLGLSLLWNLDLTREKLLKLASSIGSDVPFFFYGGTAVGTGRGTEITVIKEVKEKFLLIVTPNVDIPTANAFAGVNVPRLTNEGSKSILKICQNEAFSFNLRQSPLVNDFEKSVFELEPEIKSLKELLLENGANKAVLSGSGASVFAVFDKEETRQATIKALDEKKNWRKFAVATVSRDEYHAAFKECERLFPISF